MLSPTRITYVAIDPLPFCPLLPSLNANSTHIKIYILNVALSGKLVETLLTHGADVNAPDNEVLILHLRILTNPIRLGFDCAPLGRR